MAPEAIALDVHAHLVPLDATDVARFQGLDWDREQGVLVVDGHAIGVKPLYRPAALVDWMDRQRVEQAWISAPPPLYRQHLDEAETHAWSAHLTAKLDSVGAAHGARLCVLAHLPLHHPNVALKLASERIAAGGHRFSAPAGGAGDLALSDEAYVPLWAALDAAGAFVFMHPGECADGRLKSFYLSNLLGNPYESTVAIAHLVFGGVIDRFPNIRFCFAHGGGAAAALAGRFQQGYDTDRPGIEKSTNDPRTALRHICVDCITHDSLALELSESVFGAENILFGSDWPFPMGLLDPHEHFSSLAADRRRTIFRDNPTLLMASRGR
jgi:aminocarboxymuconate-semialdehyde decarboxylase